MNRKLLIPLLITIAYFFMGSDTISKSIPTFPCSDKINNFLSADTLNGFSQSYYMGAPGDTILIRTAKDSMWDIRATVLCKILKDSCKLSYQSILIVDTSSNTALFDTKYGKKIYFTRCP